MWCSFFWAQFSINKIINNNNFLLFQRRSSTCTKGYSRYSCIYPAVPEAIDYDWQRCQRGRTTKHPQLFDYHARGREFARCLANVNFLDVRTSQLNGARIRYQTGCSKHIQIDGCRKSTDTIASAKITWIFLVAQHSQVSTIRVIFHQARIIVLLFAIFFSILNFNE